MYEIFKKLYGENFKFWLDNEEKCCYVTYKDSFECGLYNDCIDSWSTDKVEIGLIKSIYLSL